MEDDLGIADVMAFTWKDFESLMCDLNGSYKVPWALS